MDAVIRGGTGGAPGRRPEPHGDTVAVDANGERAPGTSGRADWIPWVWAAASVAVGVAYFFLYGPLVDHRSEWMMGQDLWGIVRAAHFVGWGDLGGIYDPANGVVTFPGITVLLAPVVTVSSALGLSESSPFILLTHPTAALLVQPVELVLGSTVVFAVNRGALVLGLATRRRFLLVGAVAVVGWPCAAVWGHAEDMLAVALFLWAWLSLVNGSHARAGWLLGAGIMFQPLVGLALPATAAASPAGRRAGVAVRAVLPSVVLVGIALVGNWSQTIQAIVQQPTSPSLNHATPWVSWAPRIAAASFHHRSISVVSGGSVRTVGVLLAILIGVFVWRRRPDAAGLLWLSALALAMRCYFEPVMTPYYLAPPLVVALLAASRTGRLRFGFAVVTALVDTVYAYDRISPWVWWLPVVGMLTMVLACGYPGREHLVADGMSVGRDYEGSSAGQANDEPEEPVVGSLIDTSG